MIIKIANYTTDRSRTITDILPVDIPPAPTALPATEITLSSFFANWYSTVDVSGFYLDIANDSGFTSFVPGFNNRNISGDVSTYFVPDLSCNEDYYYRIRAYYQPTYTSPNSNEITTYTLSLNVPTLLPATDVSYSGFTMHWISVSDALGYEIDVDDNSNFSSPIYNSVDVGNVLSYVVQDLSISTTYYYRVRAYNEECISENSGVLSTTTSTTALLPPIATAATDVSYNSFNANWTTVSNATGYHLYVSTDASFNTYLTGFDGLDVGNVSTYDIPNVEQNVTYYYRLDAYNSYTTSIYSNIINVTIPIETFTACSNFAPYYASVPPVSGFLEVDSIVSDTADISTYVIEWKLNSSTGETIFISGVGSDPSIQTQHPFENPEVVFAGTLYPVIKYMYFDGVKYTSYYEPGSLYSPDLVECLDPVVVDPVTCSTVLGTDILYPYHLTYINQRDIAANKSREIKFDISPNTDYLAWEFTGYTVTEQIQIYYCTSTNREGTLLDNFMIGSRSSTGSSLSSNLYPNNYPDGSARIINSTGPVKYVTNLSEITYTDLDYLRIKITGSVLEPSISNTNWDLKLKCFTQEDISCAFFDSGISKLNTAIDPSMVLISSSGTCYYTLSYYTQDEASIYTYKTSPYYIKLTDPWLWNYTHINVIDSYTNPANRSLVNPVELGLYWYTAVSNSWMWYGANLYQCQNLNPGETITVTRVNTDPSTLVISFTDVVDYNVYVSNIASIQADPNYTTWLALTYDDPRKYGYYYIQCIDASSCGDTQSTSAMYVHLSSPIYYDANNLTITFEPVIPEISQAILDASADTCDRTYYSVNNTITTLRYTKLGSANYHYTRVRSQNPVAASWPITQVVHNMTRESFYGFAIDEAMLNGVCDLSPLGFIYDISTSGTYRNSFSRKWTLLRWWDKFSLTGDASTHENRLENWRLERKILLETDSSIDTGFETVYDVSNGIFLIGG